VKRLDGSYWDRRELPLEIYIPCKNSFAEIALTATVGLSKAAILATLTVFIAFVSSKPQIGALEVRAVAFGPPIV
jgi:hypothetical protein